MKEIMHKDGFYSAAEIMQLHPEIVKIQRIYRYAKRFNTGKIEGFEGFYFTSDEVQKIVEYATKEKRLPMQKPTGTLSKAEVKELLGCSWEWIKHYTEKLGISNGERHVYYTQADIDLLKKYYDFVKNSNFNGNHTNKDNTMINGMYTIKGVEKILHMDRKKIYFIVKKDGIGTTEYMNRLLFTEEEFQKIAAYKNIPLYKKPRQTQKKAPAARPKQKKVKLYQPKKPAQKKGVFKKINYWKISVWSDELFGYVVKKCCLTKNDALQIEKSLTELGIICQASPHIRNQKKGVNYGC